MIRKLNLIGIISISIFTTGCPQSKESLAAFEQLRRIGKLTVTDSENQAFADNVYTQMNNYLNVRGVSGVNYNSGILGAKSGKTLRLECFITHHTSDTAVMECFLKKDGNALVEVHAFRGVGMNEYGQGMLDKTPAHILARRAIDELHAKLERKFTNTYSSPETKNDSK